LGERDGKQISALVPPDSGIAAPSGVCAVATSKGIEIRWSSVLDHRVAGYRIYRRRPGKKAAVVARPGSDQSAWTDRAAHDGVPYVYTVVAVGTDGREGARGEPVSAYR